MPSIADFIGDAMTHLRVIALDMMEKNPLQKINDLTPSELKSFKDTLNLYITSLPDDGWEKILLDDFNEVCNNKIFTQDIQTFIAPPSNNNDEDEVPDNQI